jgi:hypothetical protein
LDPHIERHVNQDALPSHIELHVPWQSLAEFILYIRDIMIKQEIRLFRTDAAVGQVPANPDRCFSNRIEVGKQYDALVAFQLIKNVSDRHVHFRSGYYAVSDNLSTSNDARTRSVRI